MCVCVYLKQSPPYALSPLHPPHFAPFCRVFSLIYTMCWAVLGCRYTMPECRLPMISATAHGGRLSPWKRARLRMEGCRSLTRFVSYTWPALKDTSDAELLSYIRVGYVLALC